MNRYRTMIIAGLFIMMLIPTTVKVSSAAEDSHVVGRLTGTIQPIPGYFSRSNKLIADNYNPEFLGFRFVNSQTGKKVKMRPDSNGPGFSRDTETTVLTEMFPRCSRS